MSSEMFKIHYTEDHINEYRKKKKKKKKNQTNMISLNNQNNMHFRLGIIRNFENIYGFSI